MTPAERLEWLIEHSGLSESALSKAAGLSRQHVNTLLARLKSDPEAGFDMKTAQGLQTATGVSLDWLVSGKGHRLVEDEAAVYDGARYPNLERAIELMQSKLLDDTIERCRGAAMHLGFDRSVGEWVDELGLVNRSLRRQQKTGDADQGRLLEDEDDTPKGDQ